jgi:hypothetical protein
MFLASGTLIVPPLLAERPRRFIQRSAWKVNSQKLNFRFTEFSEVDSEVRLGASCLAVEREILL